MNILVLCTGNSARSIILETVLRHYADGRFVVYSAGSHPAGLVNPHALRRLQEKGFDTRDARSKSWDEYAKNPEMDIVITVCGNAANETCPIWPGNPIITHWGVEDPADPSLSEDASIVAFSKAYKALRKRAKKFAKLPIEDMDRATVLAALSEIGRQ